MYIFNNISLNSSYNEKIFPTEILVKIGKHILC